MPVNSKIVIIRPYKPSDYLDVKRNLREGNMFYPDIYAEDKMRSKIKNDPESILVAEVDGKVVGNIYLVTDWGPLLFGLAVRKSHRNKGVGKKLTQTAAKTIRARGYKEINLLVRQNKLDLQDMYKRWGFKKSNVYRWMYRELQEKE